MADPSPAGLDEPLRLAGLLAALSLETDLAMGHPPDQAMRTCMLATDLAREVGAENVSDVYYTTLLRYVGCTAFSHEEATLFGGDDLEVRRKGALVDFTNPKEALSLFLFGLGEGKPAGARVRIVANALTQGRRIDPTLKTANCEVAARMAERFGLDPGVPAALYEMFERWNGKGGPKKLKGEQISIAARFTAVAHVATVYATAAGEEAAVEVIRRRAGAELDPSIAEAFVAKAPDLLAETGMEDAWAAVLEAEPEPHRRVSQSRLDEVAAAFGDAVDLKSPFLHGHSSGVAALAEASARSMGLAETDVLSVRRAGLLHDLGRAGVPTGVWEKPGPLTTTEWEQVRLHPYHTERILSRSPVLAPLAPLAGMHHERLDGSGYHRGAPAALLTKAARVLAAADVYHALTEERPHRPALTAAEAARELEAQVAADGLDRDAAAAVLATAGQPTRMKQTAWPAGLTDREVEILRLLARGRSKKQVAQELFISPSTVHTHTVHVYGKIGVSTRAAAAMFAMEHDLMGR